MEMDQAGSDGIPAATRIRPDLEHSRLAPPAGQAGRPFGAVDKPGDMSRLAPRPKREYVAVFVEQPTERLQFGLRIAWLDGGVSEWMRRQLPPPAGFEPAWNSSNCWPRTGQRFGGLLPDAPGGNWLSSCRRKEVWDRRIWFRKGGQSSAPDG